MEERRKVWIKGSKEHPEKVIKTLENLGAYGTNMLGDCPNNAYFINHNGQIDAYDKSIEAGKIVIENYKEIKIDDIQGKELKMSFEPFDHILVRDSDKDLWKPMDVWYLFLSFTEKEISVIQILPYNDETKHLLNTTEEYIL